MLGGVLRWGWCCVGGGGGQRLPFRSRSVLGPTSDRLTVMDSSNPATPSSAPQPPPSSASTHAHTHARTHLQRPYPPGQHLVDRRVGDRPGDVPQGQEVDNAKRGGDEGGEGGEDADGAVGVGLRGFLVPRAGRGGVGLGIGSERQCCCNPASALPPLVCSALLTNHAPPERHATWHRTPLPPPTATRRAHPLLRRAHRVRHVDGGGEELLHQVLVVAQLRDDPGVVV